MKYPVFCLLGDRGSCKTLFMVYLAEQYAKAGTPVIANFHLYGIPFTYMSFATIIKTFEEEPESLKNSVIFMDEILSGADAYEFYKKHNRQIVRLITQIRKFHTVVFYTAQSYDQPTKRLRGQTNYIFEFIPSNIDGIATIEKYDKTQALDNQFIGAVLFDGRKYFDKYDTDEIVFFDDLP